MYHIADNFRREFIFRYLKEAFLFKNKFLVTTFLRKLIPTTKINGTTWGFQCIEVCMCNGISVFVITDLGEHGNSESIPALQTSL